MVFRRYWGWMTLPLAGIGLALSIIFIITVYRAIQARQVSRKCYILLLNRTIGDLLSCVIALIDCAYVLLARDIEREIVVTMESFFIGCFWSGMVSYVALSVLKLFAVWKPFQYRKWFTMRRCIYLMILSWFIFVIMVSYSLGVSALVKIPSLNKWSGCRMETCLRIMYRIRNAVTLGVYCFTLVVFVITVLLIRRAQRFVNSFRKRDKDRPNAADRGSRVRFPLWKLAINVATFAGFNFFYILWIIRLFLERDPCFFQLHYAENMRLISFRRCALILRIIVDPILSYVTDYQLRRNFLAIFGVNRKITQASTSRSTFQKSTYSNSSVDMDEGQSARVRRSQTVSTVT
ncbi:hypothetical protein WR25_01318 isoform C [Diploscapter pachys]|nr:hypothetical protein WR25_01318 isoform C [Diploscapter pachys]